MNNFIEWLRKALRVPDSDLGSSVFFHLIVYAMLFGTMALIAALSIINLIKENL